MCVYVHPFVCACVCVSLPQVGFELIAEERVPEQHNTPEHSPHPRKGHEIICLWRRV